MSSDPRWIMAYMLLMAALKISNPIEEFILVKIDNFTRGSGHFCLHGFHVESNAILRSVLSKLETRGIYSLGYSHESKSNLFAPRL
jgi:hypothetical protein